MSAIYYRLYERAIKRKDYSEEGITAIIDKAHNDGHLTNAEYDKLVELIGKEYT